MQSASPLEVNSLVVKYGEKVAVDHLSFSVKPGEIYGLLGPNGAGKSSTIKAILGLVPAQEGTIRVMGKQAPSKEVMNYIGAVLESPAIFDVLTPLEFFEFVASVRRVNDPSRLNGLVEAFELRQYLKTPIASLSMGNKQKVAVIAAMLHRPKLLLLDEPFNGLDVKSVRIFKELLKMHVEGGGSVIFSTHIMDVAEKICTRVGIINEGKMVAEGTVEELRNQVKAASLEDVFLKATEEEEEVKSLINALSGA
ncbi:MAG: ABC transporter ATP-binding protein [Thermoprotei archaeon]|nr:ABC transporter ATP-binding protein [TACK group archaeon]